MEKKNLISIPSLSRVVSVSPGATLLDGLLAAQVPISHSCGGLGTCGTCLVRVRKGLEAWPLRQEVEQEMADDRGLQERERLACQTEVTWPESVSIELELVSVDRT